MRLQSVLLVGFMALAARMADAAQPLKVIILAGQSNMEGQAEVDTQWGKACPEQLAGKAPVCCSAQNVTGCCPDAHGHGNTYPCHPYSTNHTIPGAYDPCPHDEVQGPTNDMCFKNGTLVYQLKDPRTKAQFAKCYNVAKGFNASNGEPIEWTTLSRVKTWQNEGVGEINHIPSPSQSVCPKGYCPWMVPDPHNKSNHILQPCSSELPLGGCGAWGNMTIGYGVGSSMHNIGPEYGFSFAIDEALEEDILVIKWAYGGTTISGNWRPPSSTINNKTAASGVVGPLYLNMVNGTRTILKNLPHYFPEFADRTEFDFVGFGWFLGWNDGCDGNAVAEYEFNMVNMIKDIRKEFGNPKMAVSIPVSGFDGWDQTSSRRLGIIQAQFNAANATRHPELGGHVIAEETRDFWRCGQEGQNCPSPQRFHFGHNAETYFLIGQAMGEGMLKAMKS